MANLPAQIPAGTFFLGFLGGEGGPRDFQGVFGVLGETVNCVG